MDVDGDCQSVVDGRRSCTRGDRVREANSHDVLA
jgi:hypothetical protein